MTPSHVDQRSVPPTARPPAPAHDEPTEGPERSREVVIDDLAARTPSRERTLPTTLSIVVSSHKGGVGKTTVCGNLGAAAGLVGLNVLVVDCDPQATLSVEAFGGEPRPGVAQLLLDQRAGRPARILDHIIDGVAPNIDLLPAAHEPWMQLKRDLVLHSGGAGLDVLLDPIRDCYDLILFDTPPELGDISRLCLTSDRTVGVLAVADQGLFSLRPLLELHAFVTRVSGHRARWLGTVFNKYVPTQTTSGLFDLLEASDEADLLRPLRTRVPLRAAVTNAQSRGLQVVLADRRADVTVSFELLLAEVLERAAGELIGVRA
jgi:chromosome partitioning protein